MRLTKKHVGMMAEVDYGGEGFVGYVVAVDHSVLDDGERVVVMSGVPDGQQRVRPQSRYVTRVWHQKPGE